MSSPRSIVVLFLAAVAAVACATQQQQHSYTFQEYYIQCGASYEHCSSIIFQHPHLSYDHNSGNINSPGRLQKERVMDGLALMRTIKDSVNTTEAGAPFFPNLEGGSLTSPALRKLVKVVLQRNSIKSLDLRSKVQLEAPTAALDKVASDICALIQNYLNGRYKSFNCSSDADMADLYARLEYSELLEKHLNTFSSPSSSSSSSSSGLGVVTIPQYQCQYWNSRILHNCENGIYSEESSLDHVNGKIVAPAYEGLCTCCSPTNTYYHNSPICKFTTQVVAATS